MISAEAIQLERSSRAQRLSLTQSSVHVVRVSVDAGSGCLGFAACP
jgi:hypothetical protein